MNIDTYLANLSLKTEQLKKSIDDEIFASSPCNGPTYGELIVPLVDVLKFVKSVCNLGVTIWYVSFWCQTNGTNRLAFGCPHGDGGYAYGNCGDYFSELNHIKAFYLAPDLNSLDEPSMALEKFTDYFQKELPTKTFFRPCLALAFYLVVPDHWEIRDRH